MKYLVTSLTILCSLAAEGQNTFPSSGNAGIGTTSPQVNFEIVGFAQYIRNPTSTSYATLRLLNDQNNISRALELFYTGSQYYGSEYAGLFSNGAFPLYFGTNGAFRLAITANGNVGIGTTSPGSLLHLLSGSPTSVQGLNGSTKFAIDAAGGGFAEFRNTGDNNTYTGMLFTDNNLGGYVTFRNYPDDKLHVGAYGGIAFEVGTDNNVGGKAERMRIDANGNVGIGTTSPNQKLTVNGTIYGKEVKVDLSVPGPDYVFEKSYSLPSLEEVKSYIDQNKHLPEVPSSAEMEKNGVQLGEMNMILLKKVEELTLYLIEQKKEIAELKSQMKTIKNRIENR